MENIKGLYRIFSEIGKLDEYKQILELQKENEMLKKENKELQKKLEFQDDVEYKNNAYWKKSDGDGPYCPRCWDGDKKLMRMTTKVGGNFATCPKCKTKVNFMGKKPKIINSGGGY